MNRNARKGSAAEREASTMLTDLLGHACRRMLGAGRKDDIGDIDGLPSTTIQVTNTTNLAVALRLKPPASEQQTRNARNRYGATLIRMPRGRWLFILTPNQYRTLWTDAQNRQPTTS